MFLPFSYSLQRLFRFCVFRHRFVLLLRTHEDVVPVADARTGRYQVTADDVLLEVSSGSTLPWMAASLSTLVVSWKDAADMKLLV